MNLSSDQQAAVDVILASDGGMFFLTGPAGSGKSFVIQHLRNVLKDRCLLTAMSGIAAQLIGGKTAHSSFGIHPTYGVYKSKKVDANLNRQLIVVDEISMASGKFFRQILRRLDEILPRPTLLMVGDFMQLPPIEAVREGMIFQSPDWADVETLRLSTPHRQAGDMKFIRLLNSVRLGELTEEAEEVLSGRIVPELPLDCVQLHSLQRDVDDFNQKCLAALPGNVHQFNWNVMAVKDKHADQKFLKNCRWPSNLVLKSGARVVLLTNTKHWVNGSTGEVVDFSQGIIRVKLDRGGLVQVEKASLEITDDNDKPVFMITQYPIMLAYALTIHKAQGMTLDQVGVNLNSHFEGGQTYVAISRCRYLDGLYLSGNLTNLKINEAALKYETAV